MGLRDGIKRFFGGGGPDYAGAQAYIANNPPPVGRPGMGMTNPAPAMMGMMAGQNPFGFPGGGMSGPATPMGMGGAPNQTVMGQNTVSDPFRDPYGRGSGLSDMEKAALIAQAIGSVGGLALNTWGAYKEGKRMDEQERRLEEDREERQRDRRARAEMLARGLSQYLGR